MLRGAMHDMMIAAAGVMDPLPACEKIVLSILLFHMPHEDTRELPTQIVMESTRQNLQMALTGQKEKAIAGIQVKQF